MATGYEDLIPAKSARSTGYDDLIPKQPTSTGIPGPRTRADMWQQEGRRLAAPFQGFSSGAANVVLGGQRLLGKGLSALGAEDTGAFLQEDAARRLAESQATVAPFKRDFPMLTGTGELGAEVLGTLPVGRAIAAPLAKFIPAAAPLAQSIRTGGFSTGRAVQTGAPLATRAGDVALRAAGGATLGGTAAAIINPEDAALGAALGGAVPFAGPALGYLGGKAIDLTKMPQKRAQTLAKKAIGQDLPEVINALRSAPPGVGVAETLARFKNPAVQALVKDSLESTPEGAQYLNKLADLTDDEAVNALSKLAGGKIQADVRATSDLAKQNLNAITTPMRESALNRANLGKEVARLEGLSADLGEQAAAKVQEVRRLMELGDLANASARLSLIKRDLPVGLTKYTYSGELAEKAFGDWANKAADASLDLGQGARFADQAAGALRSVGIKPLEGEPLVRSLKAVANNPEFAGNDVLLGSLRNVSDDVAKWTGSGGVIDARALDAIRKNSVNAAIQQLRPGMDATAQRNLAAGVLSRVKPVIDDAIEASGGAGYREYLKQHGQMSQKIAEKKLTGEALDLYTKNKDAFVRLVTGNDIDTVEKILGPGKYNIAVELAESTLDVLRKEASRHLDRVAASKQATDGQKALATLVSQNVPLLRFPSFINMWAAAGNRAISELERKLGARTTELLSKAMQNPQSAADLLEALPPSEKSKVIQLLNNPATWTKGAAVTRAAAMPAAPTNNLAPDRFVENEFAR